VTVGDLIAKLSSYPADARVTLLDSDRGWLLPIENAHLAADGARENDFVATTSDVSSDEIEGLVAMGPRTASLEPGKSKQT
jgi:hypothetical protein